MIKLALLVVIFGCAAAQMNQIMRMLMMQEMMGGGRSGSGSGSSAGSSPASGTSTGSSNPLTALSSMGAMGGAGGMMGGSSGSGSGFGGMLAGLMNNPALLCRHTENLRMIPCRRWRGLCDLMSFNTYGFPGLLKCSPAGIGCCIKDAMSYTLVQNM